MNVIALLDKFYYSCYGTDYTICQIVSLHNKLNSFIVLFDDMSIGIHSVRIIDNDIFLSDGIVLTRYYEFDSIGLTQSKEVSFTW